MYWGLNGSGYGQFWDAIHGSSSRLTWDPAAILSILNLSYICGDRTLVREVRRSPWLSTPGAGEVKLQSIPSHGRKWLQASTITKELYRLLLQEFVHVCRDRKYIYVQLSGGLDSRITAAIAMKAWTEGKLLSKPVLVTWGNARSRDAHYAQLVSQWLGLN